MKLSANPGIAPFARPVAHQRKLDSQSIALFSEGFEVQLNPNQTWLEQAVERVQARARTNRLTRQEAAETLRRVTIGGETSACAGLKNCPASFRFPITTTLLVVARLDDDLIACSVGRREVMPGAAFLPPVCADPIEEPMQWLKEVVTAFWTRLDDRRIERLRRKAVARALAISAANVGQDWCERARGRATAKRRLQVEHLFRSVEPVYVTELEESLRRITGDLLDSGINEVPWRAFQQRWPSIATRYRRDLQQVFRQGSATVQTLRSMSPDPGTYWLSFDTWCGSQTIFDGTQLVVQVCSTLLANHEAAGQHPSAALVRQLREKAMATPHPASAETVGWLRVHLDDQHRLAFIDEVQSDVVERLREAARPGGDPGARPLQDALGDWHLHGFSTIARWASAIGYRVAMHSEASAATIPGKTRSVRKWNVYYSPLIKRQGMQLASFEGYPAPIWVEPDPANVQHRA
ncbi:MAG: hypothetical protein L6Q69_01680 [Zoogloea sp.]|nr:hypothetical protein [Zoogloea sp.]